MVEYIASIALLANQSKQSGEPFPIHILPKLTAIKKGAPSDVQLTEHFVKSSVMESIAQHTIGVGDPVENGLLPTALHTALCRPRRFGL